MPSNLNKRFGAPIFWAGLIGFLLGILFSVTIWSTNRILQIRAAIPDENGTAQRTMALNLTSPSNGSVVTSDSVILSGTTSRPAIIVFSGGAQDTVVTSGNTRFQTAYKLNEGENEILVTAVDADGNESSTNLNVLYTTENLQ